MKAELKNYRQSPRKVRLVANLVKGLSVNQALVELMLIQTMTSHSLLKILRSTKA